MGWTVSNNDDYEVGFKKPPKHTQFKPGQSGNPAGRPKGTKNLATDLAEELSQQIVVLEGGQQIQVSKQRAMVKSLLAKAMKGDTQAAGVLIKLVSEIERSKGNEVTPEKISSDDQAILDAFIKSIQSQTTSDEVK